jgi:hypothetical protein
MMIHDDDSRPPTFALGPGPPIPLTHRDLLTTRFVLTLSRSPTSPLPTPRTHPLAPSHPLFFPAITTARSHYYPW